MVRAWGRGRSGAGDLFLGCSSGMAFGFLASKRHKPLAVVMRSISVFDHGPRELPGGADYVVSHFDYLNSSARAEAAKVRAVVERMFDRYPAQMQEGLRRRLRSVDNNTHLGAFFELTLHDLLLRSGSRVLAVEPDLDPMFVC